MAIGRPQRYTDTAEAQFGDGCPSVSIDIPDLVDPITDCLLAARPRAEGTLRCVVRRLPGNEVGMYVEEGNVFLLAARRSGKDWILAASPNAAEKTALARLRSHKGAAFTCVRQRALLAAQQCSGPDAAAETLHVTHCAEQLASHLPELNVLFAALPVDVGNEAAPPQLRRAPSELELAPGRLGQTLRLSTEQGAAMPRNGVTADGVAVLQSRKPKWNARTGSYELPFHGRANEASERNFQLVMPAGSREERVVLLHGKLDEERYALDFASLSPLLAFAISLSTWNW